MFRFLLHHTSAYSGSFAPRSEIEAILNKAAESVRECGDRLAELTVRAREQNRIEDNEDKKWAELRAWCIRVRSLVLAPSTIELADSSMPSSDGSLSAPMLRLLREAVTLGIHQMHDVAEVENAFKCLAWCCHAMNILSRRPSLNEIESAVSQCANLRLPEEKPLRMMKSILQRARTWQSKVGKALAPRPGETKPVNVDTLKGLVSAASDIPLSLPEESCLSNVIDDQGSRYCICGGPHYGSFMVGCDKCEQWYHGRCVQVNREEGDALNKWLCPPCKGVQADVQTLLCVETLHMSDEDDDDDDMSDDDSEEDVAIHAPLPEKLWPPFGLLQTQTAIDALGEFCCAIEDDVGNLALEVSSCPANVDVSITRAQDAPESDSTLNANLADRTAVVEHSATVTPDLEVVVSEDISTERFGASLPNSEGAHCTLDGPVTQDSVRSSTSQIGLKESCNVEQSDSTIDCTSSKSEMGPVCTDRVSNGTASMEKTNGNVRAVSVSSTKKYSNAVRVAAQMVNDPSLPGAYMGTIFRSQSSDLVEQDQAVGSLREEDDRFSVDQSRPTSGFVDQVASDVLIQVQERAS